MSSLRRAFMMGLLGASTTPPPTIEQFLKYRPTGVTLTNLGTGGSDYNSVLNTSTPPTYVAASGGVPAHLHFVGGDALKTTSILPSAFGGASSVTFFIVAGFPGGIDSTRNMAGYGVVTTESMRDLTLYSHTVIQHFLGGQSGSPANSASVNRTVYAFSLEDKGADGTVSYSYVNGVPGEAFNLPVNRINTALTPWYIGGGAMTDLDGSLPLDWFAGEAYINGVMSPADVLAHTNALKAEFSIP